MRSRMLREGSLGLFILMGLGLVTGLVLWLKGVKFGRQSYQFIVQFPEVTGVQMGSSVRFRGVTIGNVTSIQPGINGVDVTLEIDSSAMLIPRTVTILANQGGFIGETTIDITPVSASPVANTTNLPDPLSSDCNRRVTICNGDRLSGEMGVSFAELMRASTEFTETFSDPKFYNQITALTENSTNAVEGIATLATDLSDLSRSLKSDLTKLSESAIVTTGTVGQAADRLTLTAGEISNLASAVNGLVENNQSSLVTTLDNVNLTASEMAKLATTVNGLVETNQSGLVATLENVNLTASEMARLAATVNTLVESNRSSLVATLDNVNQMSVDLSLATRNLVPLLETANQTLTNVERGLGSIERSSLLTNLEAISQNAVTLSANAAEASENLRAVTGTANDPTNRLLLQQTLDSARSTFQNVQKITSDLDDLTGDPEFRDNIRRLVNGLSGLVSSTQELENQVQTARTLEPLANSLAVLEPASVESQGSTKAIVKPKIATPDQPLPPETNHQ